MVIILLNVMFFFKININVKYIYISKIKIYFTVEYRPTD